jgi:Cd2+/Zn2+-exporting ATPase
MVAGGWFIAPKAIGSIRRLSPDMNLLMSIAAVGAVLIGAWDEAAAVVFLFSLAELLESFSLHRARHAIESMMELAPDTALVRHGDHVHEQRAENVQVGDTVVIKPGARIPLDGVVVRGTSSVNQAPITGESMPVEKEAGSEVFAGSINERGSLDVRVTKLASESTLAQIIHLVEEAQSRKATAQRFVDAFARYYTPIVIGLAAVIAVGGPLLFHQSWSLWCYRALVMLVIACPCALVISTPVSIVSGLTAAARRGVLIKGGAYLEALGKLRVVALDKTGTITEGRHRVDEIVGLNAKEPKEVLRIAAALEAHSEHPLARAIVEHARDQGVDVDRAETFQSLTGKGAEGLIAGHCYFVGNHRLTEERAVCSPATEQRIEAIERRGQSAVVVGHLPHADCKGEVIGVIAVGDTIRPGAASVVQELRRAGVRRVVMLTGDNRATAEAIGRLAGVDEIAAELLPDEKVARVRALMETEGSVGMVGDGINDAPALATATIGIAMGTAGTDVALESADVVLMADDLAKLPEVIRLGRRTERIIQSNIAFSILLKLVFLGLAATGVATMWMAIASDTGASLLVTANGLRLLRTPPQAPPS